MKKNDFLLVRHSYDDHSYIDGKNDTGLTKKGIEIVKQASETILCKIDAGKVIIRHSSKKRAKETAEILCEYLMKHNINCLCVEDSGLNELYQGNFNFEGMEHIERVNFLQNCWDDFEFERKNGILNCSFGHKQDRNIILRLGENHAEWSVRIANAVLNIINDINNQIQSINVTHRGAILEIQKIIEMANGKIPIEDVEKYETIWMQYCQDYQLHLDDLQLAQNRIKNYIYQRSRVKNENHY